MSKNLARLLVTAAALLLVGYEVAGADERVKLDPNRVYDLRPPDAVRCGATSSTPVTIVFFGSPPDWYSAKYYLETMVPLMKQYPNKVSVVMSTYAMPKEAPESEEAARLMLAARKHGAFCKAMNAQFDLFKGGGRNRKGPVLTPERKQTFATTIGVDFSTLESEASSAAITDALQADKAYAQSIGVWGTPYIFVNGRLLSPLDQDKLRSMVQAELAK